MYLYQADYEKLIASLPKRAICEACGGESVLVLKADEARRVFFYLCQEPSCASHTEPYLVSVY
jgi:hypothetical protein